CAIGVQLTYLFLDYRSPTLPVFPGLVDVPGCLVQPFPFPFALLRQQGIGQRLVALCFATQFAVALPPLGCQRPVTQRALHRAPRLAGVRAIAVTALFSQTGDLIESLVHGTLARPKLQFAQVVIYLTQVTPRSCGCERPDSRGGMGRQAAWSHRKRLGALPTGAGESSSVLGAPRVAHSWRPSRHAHARAST